jgi:hypothetical protein
MNIRVRVKRSFWWPSLYLVQYKVGFQLFWTTVNAAKDDYVTPHRMVDDYGRIFFTNRETAERVANNLRNHFAYTMTHHRNKVKIFSTN